MTTSMEHSYDDYVASANEALEISLIQPTPTGLRTVASFQPKFTYPIFGDEETIVGYQDLKINLRYHASSMRPNLHVGCSKKLRTVGDTEPADIPALLNSFLPPVAFQKLSEFEEALRQPSMADYVPPGKRVAAYTSSDGRYEIWRGTLADVAVRQLVNRVQIFVPLLIEGGTLIRTDGSDPADRWTIFFLYRMRQHVGAANRYEHEFAGYSTVYRFLLPVVGTSTPPAEGPTGNGEASSSVTASGRGELELPASDGEPAFALATLPCRSRLSQFVILPPFQGRGNAAQLYRAIFDAYLSEPQTREITVEDPNEAFDDVRDLADLTFLSRIPAFVEAVHIDTAVQVPRTGPAPRNIVDPAALERLRQQTKIAPRQFHRLVEMYLMQRLAPAVRPSLEQEEDDSDEDEGDDGSTRVQTAARPAGPGQLPAATKEQLHEYKLWRLFVKQRLYRHNKEILGQLERDQRIDKLEETLLSVELEYARILSMFERRAKLPAVEVEAPSSPSTAAKRRQEEAADGENLAKKVRVVA